MNPLLERLNTQLSLSIPNASLVLTPLPQCEQLSLWLLPDSYSASSLSNDQITQLMDAPPYWSFCWASGQVLARYILENPASVAGRCVVDFGAGSGVVAIAAKLAGAERAIACDCDPVAREACALNAEANGVAIDIVSAMSDISDDDIITVADVFYDRDNLVLLDDFLQRFQDVWIADSRVKPDSLPGLAQVAAFDSHTVPDLQESTEFRHVRLYRRAD